MSRPRRWQSPGGGLFDGPSERRWYVWSEDESHVELFHVRYDEDLDGIYGEYEDPFGNWHRYEPYEALTPHRIVAAEDAWAEGIPTLDPWLHVRDALRDVCRRCGQTGQHIAAVGYGSAGCHGRA